LGLPSEAVRFEVSGPNRLAAAVEVEPKALENAATRFAQVLGDNVFSEGGLGAPPPGN
jgi:hypothetical protein